MSPRARHALALAAALLLCAAPAASALPADPGFEPLTPADGAVLAVDAGGIPVSFTCPVYRMSTAGEGFTIYGGPRDYGVGFATSPALGTDGRLRQDNLVALSDGGTSNTLPEGQCAAAMAPGGGQPRPHETPGTYYWQVWRLCTGCAGSYETGPVRRFTLRAEASVRVDSPGRAYAGYPVVVPVSLGGVPDGAAVTLQRQAGKRWRGLGSSSALDERAEVVAKLPAGSQRLRAVVRVGAQTITSSTRGVSVRRPGGFSTGPGDAGAYAGRPGGEQSVRLRVTAGGRSIRAFTAYVAMLCPSVTPGQFTTQIGTAAIGRIRIAPDGRFVAAATPERKTAIRVRGRLHDRKVSAGRVELSVGPCTGSVSYSARRGGS